MRAILRFLRWLFAQRRPSNRVEIKPDGFRLFSPELDLLAQPDRTEFHYKNNSLVKVVVLEIKSFSKTVYDNQRQQLAVAFRLIELIYKLSPTQIEGYIELADGVRHKVSNTDKLRQRTWETIAAVRQMYGNIRQLPRLKHFSRNKCLGCGYKHRCHKFDRKNDTIEPPLNYTPPPYVTASAVAGAGFCLEHERLTQLGVPPTKVAEERRAAGTQYHAVRAAELDAAAGRANRPGLRPIWVVLIVIVALVLYWRMAHAS